MSELEKVASCYCCFRDDKDVDQKKIGIFKIETDEGTRYKCGLNLDICSSVENYRMFKEHRHNIVGPITDKPMSQK